MLSFSQILNSRLNSCLKCGSIFSTQSLFCEPCYQDLKNYYGRPALGLRTQPLKTRFLFSWDPQQSDSLSFLFRHLKGRQQKSAWAFYALEFWRAYLQSADFSIAPGSLLIPSPSKIAGEKDHAFLFCEAFAEISGIEMLPALRRAQQTKAQKTQSKSQRQRIRLDTHENISKGFLEGRRVILVDDILTSGGTAMAAHKALKGALSLEVWTLASRSLSCGSSLNLL